MKKYAIHILLLSILFLGRAHAQVSVQILVAPPLIPVYVQPECPVEGYIWTPGYWAYADDDYYWVPGVWLYPVETGFLWTPGYWGYEGGYYAWNTGYWGPHVGYYGGVCYGHGYDGEGFSGGRWERGSFRYNTAVSNVNVTVVHNTYSDRSEIHGNSGNRSSYNGPGGQSARPTENERLAMKESHKPPSSEQHSHEQAASKNRSQFAKENKGLPATTGMSKVAGSRDHQPAPANTLPARKTGNAGSPAPGNKAPEKRSTPHQAAPQQHNAPPQQHNSLPAAPHNAPPQQHSNPPPAPHNAAPPQQHNNPPAAPRNAPPERHSAPPQQHNGPEHEGGHPK